MHGRGRPDEWDSLSHSYLKSNASYGDYLQRKNAADHERFHNRPPVMPSEFSTPGRDGTWRNSVPTPSSNTWRHESGGLPLLPNRPGVIAGPSGTSESWKKIGAAVAPLEAQRHIAPPGGFRNEMWRSDGSTPPSSNWRSDSQIPFNGIRPREGPSLESHREQPRKRPFPEDEECRSDEPTAIPSKIADAKGSPLHDDNWRSLPHRDQMNEKNVKVQENSQDVQEPRKERIKDPEPEPNLERTEPIQKKSSIVIHNANFEDVHLFHLPAHKRFGYSGSSGTATRPLRSEGSVSEGDRKTGLLIHDSKFEDVHMFHLKGASNGHPAGSAPPSNESWLTQYNRRIEMNKMKNNSRPPLLSPSGRAPTDFRTVDPYSPRTAEGFRNDPYPLVRLDPSEHSRSPAQNASLQARGREDLRPMATPQVPYNRLSVEKPVPGYIPETQKLYEDERRVQELFSLKPKPALLQKVEPIVLINPNDYVEEFSEDDWNEVAELVNTVPPKRPSLPSPKKMGGSVGGPSFSFFRTEIPSVRSAKGPSEQPPSAERQQAKGPLLPDYGASSAQQHWRHEDSYGRDGYR